MLYSMMCDLVISFFGKKKKKKRKKRRLLRVSSFSLPPKTRVLMCLCAEKTTKQLQQLSSHRESMMAIDGSVDVILW
jgi:hypothetical protein